MKMTQSEMTQNGLKTAQNNEFHTRNDEKCQEMDQKWSRHETDTN